jgi:hypothetical protein
MVRYKDEQAKAVQEEEKRQVCAHVYVGKTFTYSGGFLNFFEWETTVIGFSHETQRVTIRDIDSGYVYERSCHDVR